LFQVTVIHYHDLKEHLVIAVFCCMLTSCLVQSYDWMGIELIQDMLWL